MELISRDTKKLGFGTMRLPRLDPDDPQSIDIKQTEKMVDLFLERGFNYFDTAYPYHGENIEIRKALEDFRALYEETKSV